MFRRFLNEAAPLPIGSVTLRYAVTVESIISNTIVLQTSPTVNDQNYQRTLIIAIY